MKNNKYCILLADDHTMFREGLRALLCADGKFEVIAEANDGREAIQAANQFIQELDLVLVDILMPGTNGSELIKRIKKRSPSVRIIVLTMHRTEEYVRSSLSAGADGYILKDDSHIDLRNAICQVMSGRTALSTRITEKVVNIYLGREKQRDVSSVWDVLTPRERGVLKLIAEGRRNKDIAQYLSISVKTVEKHRSNLMRKLDLHSASELTAYAYQNNLIGSYGNAIAPCL